METFLDLLTKSGGGAKDSQVIVSEARTNQFPSSCYGLPGMVPGEEAGHRLPISTHYARTRDTNQANSDGLCKTESPGVLL